MGYAGGDAPAPTYYRMGDHTECFQVDFDPATVAYEDLLELFWQSHDPTRPPYKTQYASLVLAHDDAQLEQARESAERYAGLFGRSIVTRIEPLGEFHLAEDYHQKYYLRNDPVLHRELRALYPAEPAFLDSTVAARVNGYLYAGGNCLRLKREIGEYGLSPDAATHLLARCSR